LSATHHAALPMKKGASWKAADVADQRRCAGAVRAKDSKDRAALEPMKKQSFFVHAQI